MTIALPPQDAPFRFRGNGPAVLYVVFAPPDSMSVFVGDSTAYPKPIFDVENSRVESIRVRNSRFSIPEYGPGAHGGVFEIRLHPRPSEASLRQSRK